MLPNWFIIRDYYQRRWQLHLLFILMLVFPGALVLSQTDGRSIPLSLGSIAIIYLFADLSVKGHSRVLLSLPVRVRELSVTLWWLAVPLPALTVTFVLFPVLLLSSWHSALPATNWFQFLALNLALNSILYQLFRYGSSRTGLNGKDRLIAGLFSTVPILIFFFGTNSEMLLQNDWRTWNASTLLLLAAGAVCTVLSLRKIESLLRSRARRLEGTGTRAPIVTTVPKELISGNSYLYLHKFREGIRAGMFNLLFFILYLHFASDHMPLSLIGNLQHKQEWFMILMLTAIGGFNGLTPGLAAFRHWRSLPMSTSQLAIVFLKMTVANIAGLFLPLLVLLLVQNNWFLLLPLLWPGLVGLAAVCLFNALAARCHTITLVVLVGVGFALSSFVADLHLDWVQNKSLCLAIGTALILLAYKIHLDSLRKGYRLYMPSSCQTQPSQ